MIVGFSGFGFPKAHGAAFGLLAYQSTWLRVHYGPEFLCALLNEQPMGFYPPDALVHEAQRRGIEVLPPDVNASARRSARSKRRSGAGRSGSASATSSGVRGRRGRGARRRARGGRAVPRRWRTSPSRAGAGRPALEQLAWAGACDALAGGVGASTRGARRCGSSGVAAPGAAACASGHAARAAARPARARPSCGRCAPWEAMLADYATTGLTLGAHPLALLRARLPAGRGHRARDLERLRARHAGAVGGLVVARQRPGTAKGIVFLLLEDEFGTINLIVPPHVYERDRLTVRTEPLVLAEGRLERLPRPAARSTSSSTARRARSATPGREDARGVVELAERRRGGGARRRRRGERRRQRRPRRGGDAGRLPGGRARGPELRVRAAAVTARRIRDARRRRVPPSERVDCAPHGTLVFVLVFVLLGLGVAVRRDERRAAAALGAALQSQTAAAAGAFARSAFVVALIVLGVGVPAAVIALPTTTTTSRSAERRRSSPPPRSRAASSSPSSCATCHTLAAANAVAQVGPEPRRAAAAQGARRSTRSTRAARAATARCRPQLYTGQDAEDVADVRRRSRRRTDRQLSRSRRFANLPRLRQVTISIASGCRRFRPLLRCRLAPLNSRCARGAGDPAVGANRRPSVERALFRREPVS